MKILFVTPPMKSWLFYGRHISPYIGYAQLAAFLREKGFEVEVLDSFALGHDFDQMEAEVRKIKPDAVGMGAYTSTIHLATEANKRIKRVCPDCVIIGGGLHYYGLYKESLKTDPHLDYIVMGEGELTMAELCEELKPGRPSPERLRQIRGLAFRDGEEVILTPTRPMIPNLDSLPMPAYDLFPWDKYVGMTYWDHFVTTAFSRGCTGKCDFCFQWNQYEGIYRYRSGKKVAEEINLLAKEHGVKVVTMGDDNFSASRQRNMEFCEEMLKLKPGIKWNFLGRADEILRDRDLLPLMHESGCRIALIGVETHDDKILEKSGKNLTTAQIKEAFKVMRQNKIATVATVIIGFPEDTESSIKQLAAFLDELDPDFIVPQPLTPLPGTILWERVRAEGKIEIEDFALYDTAHVIMPSDHLSRAELYRLMAWMSREFYSKQERIYRGLYETDEHVSKCFRNWMEICVNLTPEALEGKVLV